MGHDKLSSIAVILHILLFNYMFPQFTNPDYIKRNCFIAKMWLWFAGVHFPLASLAHWMNHGRQEKQEES